MSVLQRIIPHPWGWASLAPVACAVHCAATPLLVVVFPAVMVGPAVEFGLFLGTVAVAALALVLGIRRHGSPAPILPVVLGVLAWWGSLLHLFEPIPEEFTTVVAALVVAGGLFWNARLQCATSEDCAPTCGACESTASEFPFQETTSVEAGSLAEPDRTGG